MSVVPEKKELICRNLSDYLKTLSMERLGTLYNHPATCLAVFRELPKMGKHFVMRLLYVDIGVPTACVSSWVNSQYSKDAEKTKKTLSELRIWQKSHMSGGLETYVLNPIFRLNLKMALTGGGNPWTISSGLNKEPDPNKRDIKYLDEYASERWDTVLHYMVGSSHQEGISSDAVLVLLHSNLMRVNEEDGAPIITRTGFQFLLMETPAQVWYFILQYLETIETKGLDVTECLNLLFQLSFATLGKDYSTTNFNGRLLKFLQHLREFGLVYQRKRTSGRFYPTRLALNIAAGESKNELEKDREGYLVVETNYRLYAYTEGNLQVALIGLFAEVLYRLPNLTVSLITRDSVRQALRAGITASQIIRYLKMHIDTSKCKTGIPPTVIDQIRLWEEERNRFTFTEGVLYNQFLSQADFETVKNFAENLGVCIWSNIQNRTIVVTKDGHDPVKTFWKHQGRN